MVVVIQLRNNSMSLVADPNSISVTDQQSGNVVMSVCSGVVNWVLRNAVDLSELTFEETLDELRGEGIVYETL